MYAGWIDSVCGGSAEADGGGVGDDGGGEEGVEEGAEGGEVVKYMDGWMDLILGEVWAVVRWGLIVRGVGWDEFFCFLFFCFLLV